MKCFAVVLVLAAAFTACQEPTGPVMVNQETARLWTPPTSARPTSVTIRTAVGTITLLVPNAPRVPALSSSLSNGDTRCDGTLLPGDYEGNVVVEPAGICFMIGAMIKGNLIARENSFLFAVGNEIRGNVELLGIDFVTFATNVVGGGVFVEKPKIGVEIVEGNEIEGNLVVKDGTAFISVCGNTLKNGQLFLEKNTSSSILAGGEACLQLGGGNVLMNRNIKVEDNVLVAGDFPPNGLQISDNRIAQDLQVYKNTGLLAKTVMRNKVNENLQCFDNEEPFEDAANIVKGNADGQCEKLVP